MDACPVCKRPEVFVFSRYERHQDATTFVAMETGHAQDKQDLGHGIAAFLQAEPTA
jgi:hypothetical protein